ncbi:glycosyltransferase family 2 protein [Paraburkholderia acidisoli]|uniref:Glycosyltransferase n=1 Tax=Paraburkholderia acidisoli TaxID=2571748 RepID=A0A7Z2JEL8_9BURK|nr:glycosyltransferase family 2 protein [Paraburkholderia acidisoli]QGZ60624.1 glycosyltransferase [Paraburkholderia acidisoli]
MSPTVSIITPTANRAAFLPAIARCVARQQVSWEWLVLDDSPAPSAFMQTLAQQDARVRYDWSKAPMTIGAKRNFLVERARGELIAHFDDDDHYGARYLADMTKLLRENHAGLMKLATFWMYAPHTRFLGYMDLNARVGLHYMLTGKTVETVTFHEKMKIGADFILFYGFAYVYRKALFETARFDDVNLGEDESFIRRVVDAGHTVLAADDTQANCLHLIHPGSTSRCFSRYAMPEFVLPRLFPEYEGYPLPVEPNGGPLVIRDASATLSVGA